MNDLISRKAAMKAVYAQRRKATGCIPDAFNAGVDVSVVAVDRLPSAQQWIPVSERLPDHDECIKNNRLFNVSDGDRSYSEWFDYDKQKFGEPTTTGFCADYAVIAWMPLPKPYEVEE